jgi:hypothetical protein
MLHFMAKLAEPAMPGTELILLPVQTLLVLQSAVFLPVVALPSVASVCVAAELGRRLPPGGGQPSA